MGLCLSKGGPHSGHHNGQTLVNDEDGFCTPEGVSSQYESPNPSGRYSFGHLETPRYSADVGDFGALASLFYKKGSRSRRETVAPNYISPLDMFLGSVSGRHRVHHVNQICTGDYSFASYLASPLLKGFDVHAMEAVAKSYAESAAKAAARDTFVFLEENDVPAMGFQGEECEGSLGKIAVSSAEECEDADDDFAKSCESEEWEEPRNAWNWDDSVKCFKFPGFRAPSEGTNERWMSVLTAVQARAKARRRQKRRTSGGKVQGPKEGGGDGGCRKKTVRFQFAGVEEGFTDDDIRSGKESEYEQALDTESEPLFESGDSQIASYPEFGQDSVKFVERNAEDVALDTETEGFSESGDSQMPSHPEFGPDSVTGAERDVEGLGAITATGGCEYFDSWQEEYRRVEIVGSEEETEFLGFASPDESDRMRGAAGGATPLVGPLFDGAAYARIHHDSLESCPSPEYYSAETSFQSQQEEEVVDLIAMPDVDNHDVEMCAGNPEADEEQLGRNVDSDGDRDIDIPVLPEPLGTSQHPSSVLPVKDIAEHAIQPRAIPVGCVVVESRMADGSRLTPQILDLSEVRLPERGDSNFGYFRARVLCSGGSSSPSASEPNSDHEGTFTFPVLAPFSKHSSGGSTFREPRSPWRDPPLADLETPLKNRSIRPHPLPSFPAKSMPDFSEITSTVSDDTNLTCDARCSFSFDTDNTETKRTHEIVLPSRLSRSLSSTPVFSPTKPDASLRSTAGQWAPSQVPPIPHLPRSRRSFSRKLKFYSLERASYAAGSKKSKSPAPIFCRRDRRRDGDGDSDSDLFEIETMSGTNAMGSSRTPPPTPTTKSRRITPAASSFDFERLTSSIGQVSRSRSKRNGSSGKEKTGPLAPSRDSKSRRPPVERKRDSVFQEGQETTRSLAHNSLKGRALLKLGLLRRSSKYHETRDLTRDSEIYRSNETSGSEYLENNPPSTTAHNYRQCGQCMIEEERAHHNYAFEWYCSNAGPPLEKTQQGFSSHKRSPSNEDRTFAVRN